MTTRCSRGLEGALTVPDPAAKRSRSFTKPPFLDRTGRTEAGDTKVPLLFQCYLAPSSTKLAWGGKVQLQLLVLLLLLRYRETSEPGAIKAASFTSSNFTKHLPGVFNYCVFLYQEIHSTAFPVTQWPPQHTVFFSSTGEAARTRYHNDRWLRDLVGLKGAWYYCMVRIFQALQLYSASLKSKQ